MKMEKNKQKKHKNQFLLIKNRNIIKYYAIIIINIYIRNKNIKIFFYIYL